MRIRALPIVCAWLAAVSSQSHAQTQVDLRTQSKSVDFSGAGSTKPSKAGTTLPATCSTGEMFFRTNAPAGKNLYACTAPNVWSLLGGEAGTVTSVGLSMPPEFTVAGTPVTNSGTLAVSKANQNANTVYAGPAGGNPAAPVFRALVAADIPDLSGRFQARVERDAANGYAGLDAGGKLAAGQGRKVWRLDDLLDVSGKQGGAAVVQMASGTPVPGNCVMYDDNGNVTDAGGPCGTGGGAAPYEKAFTAQTSVTIPGTEHRFGHAKFGVFCFDSASPRRRIEPDTFTVSPSTFDAVVTFATPQSGSCVLVGGGGGSGAGGGASNSSELNDFETARTSSTILTLNDGCSSYKPCNVRFGHVSYSYTSSATATISAGSGTAYFYIAPGGAIIAGHDGLTLNCSGCTVQSGITAFPADSIPLYTWTASSGTWEIEGGSDRRALLSRVNVMAGTGLQASTDGGGHVTLAADTAVIPTYSSGTGNPPGACSPGQTYIKTNTNQAFECTSSNTWTEITGGGGVWGSITGTLSNQTDLQTALNEKAAATHAHAAADITSGTFDNGRISQSSVTQHQAALSLAVGQVSGAEATANKNQAGGYAGLTSGTKLLKAQGDEVWGLADLSDVDSKRGNSAQVQMTTGSVSANDFAKFDSNGNLVSAGIPKQWLSLSWYFPGAVAAGVQAARALVPEGVTGCSLTNSRITAGTAGSTNTTFNIQRCTSSAGNCTAASNIYSGSVTLSSGTQSVAGGTPNTTTVSAGDAFRVDLVTAGTGLADVTVTVTYKCDLTT